MGGRAPSRRSAEMLGASQAGVFESDQTDELGTGSILRVVPDQTRFQSDSVESAASNAVDLPRLEDAADGYEAGTVPRGHTPIDIHGVQSDQILEINPDGGEILDGSGVDEGAVTQRGRGDDAAATVQQVAAACRFDPGRER